MSSDSRAPSPSTIDFSSAFDRWVASSQAVGGVRRSSSAQVYEAMWRALTAWCVANELTLDELEAYHLKRYLGSRAGASADVLSPRYAWRLLRLVERVAGHHRQGRDVPPFTATVELFNEDPRLRFANDPSHDPPAPSLSPAEAGKLITFLSRARPRAGGRISDLKWQDLRACAAVALQLGAGLSPGDVRALRTDGVITAGRGLSSIPWKLQLPANGPGLPRQTPVAPWAGRLLQHWLAVRRELGIPGDIVFPSTGSGKPWSKVAQYEAARRVLAESGVESDEGGSFRLRHTFALRQLRKGRGVSEIAKWLGVADTEVWSRYGQVIDRSLEAV